MAADLSWEHQYCLSCDRQTDGAAYCSEACRLSDFEASSTSSTPLSSPSLSTPNYTWTATPSKPQTKFYLSPAYDFSHAEPYGSTPQPPSTLIRRMESISSADGRTITPSSSHGSLSSLRSTSSTGSGTKRLSEKARQQLRDYASSFERARLQRRASCC